MFARMITVQVDPAKVDEAIDIYRDDVIPASRQQPGFVGALLVGDRKTGKGISLTVYETEDQLVASEQSGFVQEQIAKFAQLIQGTPTMEGLEVLVKDL